MLDLESRCGNRFTPATFEHYEVYGGMIHDRLVNFYVQGVKRNGWNLPYATTDTVVVRTNRTAEDGAASLRVCSTSLGQWNFARQREAIATTLITHFRNQKSVKLH